MQGNFPVFSLIGFLKKMLINKVIRHIGSLCILYIIMQITISELANHKSLELLRDKTKLFSTKM